MLLTEKELEDISLTFISDNYIQDANEANIVTVRDENLQINKAYTIVDEDMIHYLTIDDLKESGLTDEIIDKAALDNVKNSNFLCIPIFDIINYLAGLSSAVGMFKPALIDIDDVFVIKGVPSKDFKAESDEDFFNCFVDTINGSSIIYNNNSLDKICEKLNTSNIVIIPCSTQELICFSDNLDANDVSYFLETISYVNHTELDYLTEFSNSLFYYEKGKELSIYDNKTKDNDIER